MEYNFTGKTILIVEDEEVNLFFFEKVLRKTNATLFFVKDGNEAIEMVKKNNRIDLVLMDIRLPIMDGIEATTKIKQLFPEMPIIIQTASALPSVNKSAIESGCDEFITKPIRVDYLLSLINKYLIF